METIADFRKRVIDTLEKIDPEVLAYHEDEFWMIRTAYEGIEFYAHKHRLFNTAVALPLARGLHNNAYRKLPVIRGGVPHHPPYLIHCLTVTKMLADLWLPLSDKEKDILLAASLCHDTIEDLELKKGGLELVEDYHLDPLVYETVCLVSKKNDFTLEEEIEFFKKIRENKLALLIKLSDRGHNVTDIYNMSEKKINEYIGETRAYFLPMCDYARTNYPELSEVIEIMQDQLICLTKTVEKIKEKYDKIFFQKNSLIKKLRKENSDLVKQLDKVRMAMINE